LFVAFTGKKQPKQVHFLKKFRQNAQISKSRVLASGFFMKSLSRSFNQVLVSKVMVLTTSLSTPHKENAPWKHALHSHIFWNLFHVELYTSLSQGCTFVTAFAQLAQKCRYHCELHTTESEMDLNYQHLRLRFSQCTGWTELTSEIFCSNSFLNFSYQKSFFFSSTAKFYFASTFYK